MIEKVLYQYQLKDQKADIARQFNIAGATLLYLGIEHTYDINSETTKFILNNYEDFINQSGGSNVSIGIEGWMPPYDPKMEDSDVIAKYGEQGLLAKIAREDDFNTMILGADNKNLIKFVLCHYKLKLADIAEWVYLNQLKNILKPSSHQSTSFRFTADGIVTKMLKDFPTVDKSIYQNINQTTVEAFSSKSAFSIPDDRYTYTGAIINRALDQIIVTKLVEALSMGSNIFAVAGRDHINAELPALIALENPESV